MSLLRPSLPRLEILRGPAVLSRFRDPAFLAAVERLHQACPWATAGQRPHFLRIWLETYATEDEPWLALAAASPSEIVGLLPLVDSGSKLEYAGRVDCEYHAWLALPEASSAFIQSALRRLRREARKPIVLAHLPPTTPLDWARKASWLSPYLELTEDSRLVVPLGDPHAVALWVKDKSRLRTSWNKLARTGKLVFRRVHDVREIDCVLERFMPMFELRKGAAYGMTPFRDDPKKRGFLLAQASVPGLLHVTVLERDGEVLAAHVATAGTRELSVVGLAHSEFEARFSPGSLLLLELVQLASREGFEVMDFTPGSDPYKARFAKQSEPVFGLITQPTLRAAAKSKGKKALWAALKRVRAGLEARAEADPRAARVLALVDRLRRREPPDGAAGLPTPAALWPLNVGASAGKNARPGWNHNPLEDLMRVRGTREEYIAFLRRVTVSLRAGGELYTRWVEGELKAACFVVPASALPSVALPEDARVLYVGYVADVPSVRDCLPAWLDELAGALPSTPHVKHYGAVLSEELAPERARNGGQWAPGGHAGGWLGLARGSALTEKPS